MALEGEERKLAYQVMSKKRKSDKKKIKPMTDEERKVQIKKWTTFYRRNWNIYAKRELGIPLYFFQEVLLFLIGRSEVFFEMCSRGLTKSFIASIAGLIQCILYPNSEVVLTSKTMGTAKKLVKKKIEDELCKKMSPKLKYYYETGQIKFRYDKTEIKVDFLFNNSWILILPEEDSSLGERACMLIFEEARIMKQYFVDSVFMPMSRPRQAQFLLKSEYQDKDGKPLSMYVEPCRKIYLTSTKYKYMWFWNRWKKVVQGTFNNKKTSVKYNFFCGDIHTALSHGIKTQQDYDEYRETMSELEFDMEILNIPQGEVEGAFYGIELFKENSIIEESFVPPTPEEYIVDYLKGDISYFRKKRNGEIRTVYVDFAFSDSVKKGKDNDNTVIGCMSGYPNEDFSNILRNCEYMETYSGGKKDESILRIRELFYLYQADVLLVDLRNGGEDRWVDLSKPYYHEEMGLHMNGFGIYPNDQILNFFCESGKIENLRGRTVDTASIPVTIPVIGTPERNNNYHIAMKSALSNHTMRLLIDEIELKQKLDEDMEFMLMDSETKMRHMLGYIQLDKMVNEAVKLEQVVKNGFLALKEPNTVGAKKDRIVATEYSNYFFHLLELEMLKGQQEDEIDWDEIQLTF